MGTKISIVENLLKISSFVNNSIFKFIESMFQLSF